MTDFGPWTRLIRKFSDDEVRRAGEIEKENGGYVTLGRNYYQIPLDDYQIVNLLGLLLRVPDMDRGDFYWETIGVLSEAVKQLEIDQQNNYGDQVNAEFIDSVMRGDPIE